MEKPAIQLVHVRALLERLKHRKDLTVDTEGNAWSILIPKGPEFVCEVTVPIDWCFEWFACVKQAGKPKPVWQDWMDHYGASNDQLDASMAECIESFVNRVAQNELKLPLAIYEAKD